MEIKKNIPTNTVTRRLVDLDKDTGNIYESINIIARRANQISAELKAELNKKLSEFSSPTDTMEETFENREQIEISRYYERLPKPVIIATEEFLNAYTYYKIGRHKSAIVAFRNALKKYPESSHREELMYYIVKSGYELAHNSVENKQADRYLSMLDSYYSYLSEYPESKHLRELGRMAKEAKDYIDRNRSREGKEDNDNE